MTAMDFLIGLRSRPGDEHVFKKERWITLAEGQVIYDLIAGNEIYSYFECGTANGYSTCWAALGLEQNTCCPTLHTWDPHDRTKVWALPELTQPHRVSRCINFHNEKYNDSVKQVVSTHRLEGGALFFIDGDHRWRRAKNDISNTMAAAQPGDIMLLHDVKNYDGLRMCLDDFREDYRVEVFDTERGMGAVWL